MGAVFRWVKYIYEWCRDFGTKIMGSGAGEIDSLVGLGNGVTFYVDHEHGNDSNDGKSWARAFATIQKAITTSNALVDWDDLKYNTIWVKPGVYAENLDGDIFFVHIVGLGIRGDDSQAEIHPATGSVLAKIDADHCYLNGAHLANLWLEVDQAVPILDIEVANNTIIESCTFTNGAAVAATGIDTDNSGNLTVRRCHFVSGQTTGLAYGMYFRGGADKYLHNAHIHDNVIFADVGIWIENTCTASQTVIQHNKIVAGTIGIDDNNGGSYVMENYIVSADCIDHAGGQTHTIGNRVQEGAGQAAANGWEA